MRDKLSVWILNPYHAGSHAAWAEGYAARSRHAVDILGMDGHFWKWRMQGGAIELAAQASAKTEAGGRPDVLLATSMVNLPAFLALTRRDAGLRGVPAVLYMHENQLTYPTPPSSKRDLTYGMFQHLSMLAADRICFNSGYHLDSWFDELPRLLKHFPDYTHMEMISVTRSRSMVLPVGCDLTRLDCAMREPGMNGEDPASGESVQRKESLQERPAPLVLWNQRWEYDKDPGTMLEALYRLAAEGLPFRVALAGENFRVQPAEFAGARERLGPRLAHFGYVPDPAAYARLLWEADVVLSTAIHEFFGVSIVEAMYCGCFPVLPARLSYPELIPAELQGACLYHDFSGLLARLRAMLSAEVPEDDHRRARFREAAGRFDWSRLAPAYDDVVSEVAASRVR